MKTSIAISILTLLLSCSDTRKESTSTVAEKKWYEGGTLHKKKVLDWKNATSDDKLATCADFAASVDKSVPLDVLLVRATELRACINEAIRGVDNLDKSPVTEIAALCMVTLRQK